MEKEVEAAGEVANPELSGGFQGYIDSVFNILGNFFGWLSTHQGLGLIIILVVLGLIIWLLVRAKKYRRQLEDEKYTNKKEMTKKDARIEEQEKKLTALQKKLSDQQGVVSEALMGTMSNLTGYDADQLQGFFKSLIQISENPLQIADTRTDFTPGGRLLEAESNVSREGDETKDKNASLVDASAEAAAEDKITPDGDNSEEKHIENGITSDEGTSGEKQIEDRITSAEETLKEVEPIEDTNTVDDSLKGDHPGEKTASSGDSSANNDVKEKTDSSENSEEEVETKK